jgi:hypothetical protein
MNTTWNVGLAGTFGGPKVALCAAMAIALSGCGSSSDEATSGGTAAPASVVTPAAVTSDAASSKPAKTTGTPATAATPPAAAATTASTATAATTTATAKPTTSASSTSTTTATAGTTSTASTTNTSTTTTTSKSSGGSGSTSSSGSGGSTTVAVTIPATPATKKSVSSYVACTGSSDDTAGFATALKAASNNAFTLIVDCPVTLKIGQQYQKSLYIDNGTAVQFTGNGKLTVDNVMVPAFVIANSTKVTLIDWNVQYDGGLPIDGNVGGYLQNGVFVPAGGDTQPGGAFNNFGITGWLAANRGIKFNGVTAVWAGGIVPMAVFYLSGDTSAVSITGMKLYVSATTGVDKFIPVAFSMTANFKSNQSVTSGTPRTSKYMAVPHDITFANIDLDGTYMGWLGNSQDAYWENITSHRYGDLQDANGNNVGGMRKWFAPPHLFYLNYDFAGDASLANVNLQLKNITDLGIRLGTARDKGGSDSVSGYANSLKIGCNDCFVDTYKSYRPDGLLDVLTSSNLTISNVQATYDSSFLNNLFPGWRFPGSPYSHLTFENISLQDVAAAPTRGPIGNATSATNTDLVFTNVSFALNKWSGNALPMPTISGTDNEVSLAFSFASNGSRLSDTQKNAAQVTLQATPATVKAGATVAFNWGSRDATSCSAAGSWSGALGTSGSRTVKMATAGNYDYTVNCLSSGVSSASTVRVVVQ